MHVRRRVVELRPFGQQGVIEHDVRQLIEALVVRLGRQARDQRVVPRISSPSNSKESCCRKVFSLSSFRTCQTPVCFAK